MRRLRELAVAVLALGRLGRRSKEEPERVVPAAPPDRPAESALIVLVICAGLCAVAFIFFYATSSLGHQTQLLGASLGLCFAFVAAALILTGRRLIVNEELEEEYPEPEHPEEQDEIARLVLDSGSKFTRRRLLRAVTAAAAGAIGLALLTPAISLGPFLDTNDLYKTPWRRGRRLVDEHGRPLLASDIEENTFYTAYPERSNQDLIGAPLVVIRLPPDHLQLPPDRRDWAPGGILAYSKVCTHAGCAIALYRKPLYPPLEAAPALVCPCHYSTFDPAAAGKVLFGPAGRALPQLPLMVDASGELRAAGNFSGPVGPSWWGVRMGKASS